MARKRACTITNVEMALRIYYSTPELTSAHIRALFGNISKASITVLKREVIDKMKELHMCSYTRYAVNTNVAFEVWGIDVADLERRYKKQKALFGNMVKPEAVPRFAGDVRVREEPPGMFDAE